MPNQRQARNRPGLTAASAAAFVLAALPGSALAVSQAPAESFATVSTAEIPINPSGPMGFDSSLPFEIIAGGDGMQPHVDTVEGVEVSSSEVEAIFARPGLVAEPGRALASSTKIYHWRNTADDPDIRIEADANVPIETVQLLGEVFVDWREVIDLDIPAPEWHHIRLAWSDSMQPGVLAGAATGWVTVNQNGSTFVVPRFLANVNGASTASGAYTLDLVINSQINWDFNPDPDDSSPNDAYYLKTVLLHEVGHALGVASGVDSEQAVNSSVLSPWGANFFGNRNAAKPFASLRANVVETNNLWSVNTDGTWEKIYDPLRWSQGSSLSHLDEAAYEYVRGETRTPGALMTPFLTNGEVNHIDGVIAGLLSQTGYETFLYPSAPVTSASSSNGVLRVNVSPGTDAAMNVPAKQWVVTIKNPAGTVVRNSTISASNRRVDFGGFATSGTYTATVAAEIDGQRTTAAPVSTSFTAVPRTTVAKASSIFGVIYATDYLATDADTLRLYRAFFERDPDLVGIQYWINQSRNGASYDDMAFAFATSNEFTNRYQNLTNQQFLQVVYRNVLNRNPDQAGFDYWYNQILGGLPRHLAVRWIAESSEFSTRHRYLPQKG